MEIGGKNVIRLLVVWSTNFFPPKKAWFFPDKVRIGRGRVGVRVRVKVRVSVQSSLLDIFFNPSHNTGTTRGPHQNPWFLYFILDKNPFVRLRRLVNTIHTAVVLRCASIIYQQRLRTTITKWQRCAVRQRVALTSTINTSCWILWPTYRSTSWTSMPWTDDMELFHRHIDIHPYRKERHHE